MSYCRYALGGFDGTTMTPSVEIYDPRRGEWMAGDPMNQHRGYLAAGVLNESIFVIGGIRTDNEIVEMVYFSFSLPLSLSSVSVSLSLSMSFCGAMAG